MTLVIRGGSFVLKVARRHWEAERLRLWLFASCAHESMHDLTKREPAHRLGA